MMRAAGGFCESRWRADMSLSGYLFEKACYPLDSLAFICQDLPHLAITERARREIGSHVEVALRHALLTLHAIAHAPFHPERVVSLLREGRRGWAEAVKPALEGSLF